MSFTEIRLVGETNSSGVATINGTKSVIGKLFAIAWIDGDLDDNNTAVISTQGHDASQTLLTIGTAEGDDDEIFYPRALVHDEGADVLVGANGGDREMMLVAGTPRLVIAAGGDTKTGGCILYIEE